MSTVPTVGPCVLYGYLPSSVREALRCGRSVVVRATGSATLAPQEDGTFALFVYLAPRGLPAHARCLRVDIRDM
ncbi:MAG: hypothetical protein ACI4RA_06610 [Kiritimatiellia bacterium]